MALLAKTGAQRPTLAARQAGRRSVQVAKAVKGEQSAALAAGVAATSLLAARPALAEDGVDTAVATVTQAVTAAGAGVKSALELVQAGVRLAQQGYEAAAPVIKEGVDIVAPVVNDALKATTETAVPLLQRAAPVVSDTLTGAVKASGVDVDSIGKATAAATRTAAEGAAAAQPLLAKVLSFLTTTEPVLLAEYGLGAVALYYLAPALLGGFVGGLRGYAGDVTAAQALDLVASDGGAVLIDIRTEREKEASGLADVPGGARGRLLEVEYAYTEDRKLRGQLRDPAAIEAQVTALQIAALKRIGKGSKVVLLDRFGGAAKAVAKELARRGFGRVYVVAGGFDGRGGWVGSKLLVKPTAGAFGGGAPSPLPAAFARTLSTRTTAVGGRKALPAPSK